MGPDWVYICLGINIMPSPSILKCDELRVHIYWRYFLWGRMLSTLLGLSHFILKMLPLTISYVSSSSSLIRWTWVWASSRSWWWMGKPGKLQSTGLQRVGHDWVTELNWSSPPSSSCHHHLRYHRYHRRHHLYFTNEETRLRKVTWPSVWSRSQS